jgi:hypothetical protein
MCIYKHTRLPFGKTKGIPNFWGALKVLGQPEILENGGRVVENTQKFEAMLCGWRRV